MDLEKNWKKFKQRDKEFINDFWLRYELMILRLVKVGICPDPEEQAEAYSSFVSREFLLRLNPSLNADVICEIEMQRKVAHKWKLNRSNSLPKRWRLGVETT